MLALAVTAAIGVWTFSQYAFDAEPGNSARDEARPIAQPPNTPAPTGELSQPARANLAALFSSDDYPDAAIREEAQGLVAFQLTVGRRGRVKRCEITVSSGHRSLDTATCRILKSRARFEPARDRDGKRIEDQTAGRIRWVLPDA